ncbi:MAG: fasciclin domain-containing protein [Thermonemataceae bacterium]|nr:fasciclin domain-containing protein [Thermonemataceae bacterium]
MKTKILGKYLLASLLVGSLFVSCKKDDDNTPVPTSEKTITQIVIDDANFSFLEAAVVKAGLDDDLASGTLTVFAPTNDAFKAAGFATEDDVRAADVATLNSILQNHVLSSNRTASGLVNGEILTTISNKPLVVSKSSNVTINNAKVSTADVAAKNGTIHIVDAVILPRTSILDAALSNSDLSLLSTAVANVSKNTSTNVAALLIGNTSNKLTVFAPTNAAFTAAGFDNAFLSNAANATAILDILTYHLLSGQVDAADVPAGPNAEVTTYDGSRKIYATRDSRGVFINGIQVAAADVAADNGVVHVLGNVLIPASDTLTDLVANDSRFSRLLQVIQYVDANTSPSAGLADLLDGTTNSPFTVFAPVNAAFDFLDADSDGTLETTELDAVGATALGDIVKRHVVLNTRAFSSDLSDNQVINAANGTLTVNISGSTVTITPNSASPVSANVAVTNVITTNGVAHAIDAVLR